MDWRGLLPGQTHDALLNKDALLSLARRAFPHHDICRHSLEAPLKLAPNRHSILFGLAPSVGIQPFLEVLDALTLKDVASDGPFLVLRDVRQHLNAQGDHLGADLRGEDIVSKEIDEAFTLLAVTHCLQQTLRCTGQRFGHLGLVHRRGITDHHAVIVQIVGIVHADNGRVIDGLGDLVRGGRDGVALAGFRRGVLVGFLFH